MFKLITSSKNSDELSIGFDRSRNRRRDELAQNKNVRGKYHLRIMLKEVFRFAECHEKATRGLGCKLTLTRNKGDAVLDKTLGIAVAGVRTDHLHLYIPHYTPSMQHQNFLANQVLSKSPTELKHIERSVFMKEVKSQNLWNFELGPQESMNVPIWTIIGSQRRDRQDSQNLNNDTFLDCLLHLVIA